MNTRSSAAPRSTPEEDVAPWRALLMAHSRALRAIEADLQAAGTIPLTWYDVLLELHAADGPLRMQDLGERVVLSRTRVSRLVDELETEGLVERVADPDDGRAVLAAITPAGRDALKSTAPNYLRGIDDHFLRHLTASERRAIERGLTKVVEANAPVSRRV
ncbi:MAG: MarR family transcriptional regulator [Ilumatobacter sp.]|nr:MarR family transcriptional regulator [Ilumatobacter sp.]